MFMGKMTIRLQVKKTSKEDSGSRVSNSSANDGTDMAVKGFLQWSPTDENPERLVDNEINTST